MSAPYGDVGGSRAAPDIEAFARGFFKVFDVGDWVAVRRILHPNVRWTPMGASVPMFRTFVGADEIIDTFIAPARAQFMPGSRSAITHVIAADPWVVVELEGSGRFKDGRDYRNTYCFLIEVRDGLICQLREYMDTGCILNLMKGASGG